MISGCISRKSPMRTAKILTIVVGAVIACFVLALLAVRLFVDPNDYKPRIEAAVKNATSRELLLQGAIKLSVFPWIALELGPASLGAGQAPAPAVQASRGGAGGARWP